MRVTVRQLKQMKRRGEKIPMVTVYDYTAARLVDAAGIPVILVGDSLGEWMLGYGSTLPVTMDDMVHHVKAVVRGAQSAHVVADMPFMSYQADDADALSNAGRLLKEGGAQSIKLEGGRPMVETVRRMVDIGIPVMAHIGFTPQSENQLGKGRIQGKLPKAAASLIEDAVELEAAGAYSIVLELVPAQLAGMITERLSIPTIGIGAGVHCDGQVQVFHDMLGMIEDFMPKHARHYAELGEAIKLAMSRYIEDVQAQTFPSDSESHQMKQDALEALSASLAK